MSRSQYMSRVTMPYSGIDPSLSLCSLTSFRSDEVCDVSARPGSRPVAHVAEDGHEVLDAGEPGRGCAPDHVLPRFDFAIAIRALALQDALDRHVGRHDADLDSVLVRQLRADSQTPRASPSSAADPRFGCPR